MGIMTDIFIIKSCFLSINSAFGGQGILGHIIRYSEILSAVLIKYQLFLYKFIIIQIKGDCNPIFLAGLCRRAPMPRPETFF